MTSIHFDLSLFLISLSSSTADAASSTPPSIGSVLSVLSFLIAKYLEFAREYKMMTHASGVHLESTEFLIENLLFIVEANVRFYVSAPPSSISKGTKEAIAHHVSSYLADVESKAEIAECHSVTLWTSRLHRVSN